MNEETTVSTNETAPALDKRNSWSAIDNAHLDAIINNPDNLNAQGKVDWAKAQANAPEHLEALLQNRNLPTIKSRAYYVMDKNNGPSQTSQRASRLDWSPEENKALQRIMGNPANQLGNGRTNWDLAATSNAQEWEFLLEQGRTKRAIKERSRYLGRTRPVANKPTVKRRRRVAPAYGNSVPWTENEVRVITKLINDPALRKGGAGRKLDWKRILDTEEAQDLLLSHTVGAVKAKAVNLGKSVSKTNVLERREYHRLWRLKQQGKESKLPTEQPALAPVAPVQEIRVKHCPECGANLMAYFAASTIKR